MTLDGRSNMAAALGQMCTPLLWGARDASVRAIYAHAADTAACDLRRLLALHVHDGRLAVDLVERD